jgi:hypothetical protein
MSILYNDIYGDFENPKVGNPKIENGFISIGETKYFLGSVFNIRLSKADDNFINYSYPIYKLAFLLVYFSIIWTFMHFFCSECIVEFFNPVFETWALNEKEDRIVGTIRASKFLENYYHIISFICLIGSFFGIFEIKFRFFDFRKRKRYLLEINKIQVFVYFDDALSADNYLELLLHEIRGSQKT